MEVQYLDNITKKIIFAAVEGWERILNFELGGTGERILNFELGDEWDR